MTEKQDGGYKNLEVWRLVRELVIDIHRMTLEKLPKFEMFEQGSQIRRSVKSVKSTIVEGYGRRRYKQEFMRFLAGLLPASSDLWSGSREAILEWPSSLPGSPDLWSGSFT